MKNKVIFIIIVNFLCFLKISLGLAFTFNSSNIEILDKGNQINAFYGEAFSDDKNLQIKSDKFIYLKKLKELSSFGNGAVLINSKKLSIKFDSAVFEEIKSNFIASGNVEIKQENKNLIITTSMIFYDQKNNIISSDKTTKIKDKMGNLHLVDSFIYELDNNLIKVNNLITQDINQNTYKANLAFIKSDSGKIFGKDIEVNLIDNSSNSEQNYRFKGNKISIEDNLLEITKGVFTTCKKRDGCPPWQFTAKNITHDKKKREISYEKAMLKIYDFPIAYFPKFFHPDPTVERKSGFLIPSIKNSSNLGSFVNLPYYYVLSDNKDFTFSPRLYDDSMMLQTEYRQKGFKSNHLLDLSILDENNSNIKSHLLYDFKKDLEFNNFEQSQINLKVKKVSNDIYFKSQKIEAKNLHSKDILDNILSLDLYSNDLSITLSSEVYENLNKSDHDRYEYILPRILISKNFNNTENHKGSFSFQSESVIRNYDTNKYEKQNINNIIFKSNNKINKLGFLNNYQYMVRNANFENKNTIYKNKKNFYISGIYQFNSSIPFIKENESFTKILKPQFAFKAAPEHTKDERDIERKVDITNIYSLNRLASNTSVEGGLSAAYGIDYSIQDKFKKNEIFKFKIANNFRIKDNYDLSRMNQMGSKISNFFTETNYKPNQNLNFKYYSSIKNNLSDINYENFISNIKVNNFITTFDYLNENNTLDKNSYLSNSTKYKLNKSNEIGFSTRKNKTKKLTEYYNLMYQYINDCLAASIEYNKDFYSDRSLKPDESFIFKLTITPFTQIESPAIKK